MLLVILDGSQSSFITKMYPIWYFWAFGALTAQNGHFWGVITKDLGGVYMHTANFPVLNKGP